MGQAAVAVALPADVPGLISTSWTRTMLPASTCPACDLMDKVIAARAPSTPVRPVSALLAEITDDLMPHLLKEEQVLFPISLELAPPGRPRSLRVGAQPDQRDADGARPGR